MRNLKCVARTHYTHLSSLPCTASGWDTIHDAILFTLGPTKDSPVIELRSVPAKCAKDAESQLVASWDVQTPPSELECDAVISLHHLVSSETTCLVLAGGDIVVVRSAPLPDQEKIEIVGSVDAGITAAAWSPDEDLLAITTRADTLLFMTACFDHVATATFSPEDAKLSEQVSVGWGRRETQFQGKRARALRDPTVPEQVDLGLPSLNDDQSVSISWRGDGALIAINTAMPQRRRMVRVFSREGVLHSVSEPVDGLEGALAWKPSGQIIAGVQRTEGDTQVVFFERNGLRHGGFSLRLTPSDDATWASRITLAWNVDSSVLGVVYLDRIQLWTMGNYHYYLKQEMFAQLPAAKMANVTFNWHPERALRLLFGANRQFKDQQQIEIAANSHSENVQNTSLQSTATFSWSVNNGSVNFPHDYGLVLVIDGRLLRITPFRDTNIPPPMALHEILLASNAVDVAVSDDNSKLAVLSHNSIFVYQYSISGSGTQFSEPTLQETLTVPFGSQKVATQICFNHDQNVYVLLVDVFNHQCSVSDVRADTMYKVPSRPVCSTHLFASVNDHELYVLQDCRLFNIQESADGRKGHFMLEHVCSLPNNVCDVKICTLDRNTLAISMTNNGVLYANEHLLIRDCSSFLLINSHIIVTTANGLLKIINLDASAADLHVPPDDPGADERCRKVEYGAKLIVVIPSIYAVVLQMPRGNLETIYPRALILASVRYSIDAKQYKRAFLACRKNRMDLNILHDHNPAQFLSNVPLFIRQLHKLEHVDLFLSQLSESNVCATLYHKASSNPAVYEHSSCANQSHPGVNHTKMLTGDFPERRGKVNRVCNAFLEALYKEHNSRVQNLITAHVCKTPPDIIAGLSLISNLYETDPEHVESAIEHICFLTDPNLIYDTALGTYDLQLALSIAQQSQKDPREYLLYLQGLQMLNEFERKFQIDDDLKRYADALAHLQSYADTERFLVYMHKHQLYREALNLMKFDERKHDSVMRGYADFLSGRNRFTEAAMAYESLNEHALASSAYASAQMWRESLSCAHLANLPTQAIFDLAKSLTDSLVESKSYQAAASILRDHMQKLPDAARMYCKGYCFSDAISLLALCGDSNLIPNIVDTELVEGFSALTELVGEFKGQLQAQTERLRELRKKKENDPLAYIEADANTGKAEDVPDNISLVPSETSVASETLLTRYTGRSTGTVATGTSRRTSKNRRREERKRARGKKGSVYEEEYLVNSISRLIERVNATIEDLQRTVETLCRRGMWERARALQSGFLELLNGCHKCVPEVWETENDKAKPEVEESGLGTRPAGADGVLWDSLNEARKDRRCPVLKVYVGCDLLNQ